MHGDAGHGVTAIDAARNAAVAEIVKIRQQEQGLTATIEQLNDEQTKLVADLAVHDAALCSVEEELALRTPGSVAAQQLLDELHQARDHVRHGQELLSRKKALLEQQTDFGALKPSNESKLQLRPQSAVTHAFAQTVANVLEAWHFPGGSL